jgi:hypothetical protein
MFNLKKISKLTILVLVFTFLTGCASLSLPASPTPTSVPPIKTPIPATEQSFTDIVTDFEILFTGEDCFVTGPDMVESGDYTFKFIDKSGIHGYLQIFHLTESKTYQDILDPQSEPGELYPKPRWVHDGTQIESDSQVVRDYSIDIETWRLDEVGIHVISCYLGLPHKCWFAAPVNVQEKLSD